MRTLVPFIILHIVKTVYHLVIYMQSNRIHNIGLTTAQQAKIIRIQENMKIKLCKCVAAIWYNKTCKLRHLTPRYIHITINEFILQLCNGWTCRVVRTVVPHTKVCEYSLYKTLLMMDRRGPKHVELT